MSIVLCFADTECNYAQKMIIFTTFNYNAFPMHVLNYAIVYSGLCLDVSKICKRLTAKNKILLFTRVIVSPLLTNSKNLNNS